MNLLRYAAVAILFPPLVPACAQTVKPLKLIATIPLPDLHEGDFDHFAVDLEGHRLFLAAEENGKVLVFDTNTNSLVHTIADLQGPHSVVYRPDSKKLFVVDGDDSAVKIYSGDTYELAGRVNVEIDADSMSYDPDTHYIYVVNGGRAAHTSFSLISVIDTTDARKLKDIRVNSNQVEALALEKSGPRLFCNITGENAVGVVDRTNGRILATWPLPTGYKRNVALALDESNHRLFIVTADPASLLVLNSDNGTFVASKPSVRMVDDVAYDPRRKRLYVSGDKFVDVFKQIDPNTYVLVSQIPGSFRAKTALFVPELDRYYLAVPKHESQGAEVRVYEVLP